MLKIKHKIKNTSIEIDSVQSPKSFVMDLNNRIFIEYEIYQNELDIDNPEIKPIETYNHKITPADDDFLEIQQAIFDIIEAMADQRAKRIPGFEDAIIKPKRDIVKPEPQADQGADSTGESVIE